MDKDERFREIRKLIRKKYGRRRPTASQILQIMKENKFRGKKKK
jgi:hypothetical protein